MNKIETILDYLKRNFSEHIYSGDKFKLLISTVLSQRTRDETTERVSKELFEKAETPQEFVDLDVKEIERTIKPIGFYHNKAKYIKEISKELVGKKVPDTLKELTKLPGIGRKTANIVLSYGFGKSTVAVDTHVERVSKRIGLVGKDKSVYDVEKKLEELFPKEYWRLINLGLVRFGKTICKPRNPLCNKCNFSSFCEYYKEVRQ